MYGEYFTCIRQFTGGVVVAVALHCVESATVEAPPVTVLVTGVGVFVVLWGGLPPVVPCGVFPSEVV